LQESKAAVAPRTICYLIKKAENKWWPRLLKKEGKPPVFLKVDWDKWQDEDDEDIGCKSSMFWLFLYLFSNHHLV
jgi:prostaglandin-E synthase